MPNYLINFVDQDRSFREQLSPEQIKRVRIWARTIPSKHQRGHIIPMQKIPRKRLEAYLSNLIPGFPQGDKKNNNNQ